MTCHFSSQPHFTHLPDAQAALFRNGDSAQPAARRSTSFPQNFSRPPDAVGIALLALFQRALGKSQISVVTPIWDSVSRYQLPVLLRQFGAALQTRASIAERHRAMLDHQLAAS